MVVAKNPFGEDGQAPTDAAWIIISAFIIFTMQSGFGLLESGLVSRKSEANVMVKNMIDVALGGISYWFVGYAFSFGPNSKDSNEFSGDGDFLTRVGLDDAQIYTQYFFQLSFATTASTIVSGAVAERVKLPSYMIFATINTAFIYVFPAHWMWDSNGWLATNGAYDFAGSAVVHMCGGAAALAGTLILGPRHGKYDNSDKPYGMASPTNVVLGTFFLWWGWIGFNCGSTFALSGGLWRVVSRVAVVTMNGAMAGGLSAILLGFALYKKKNYILDIPQFVSGILGGLVSITAAASVITTWEALIIGFIGGWIANGVIILLERLHIDDPVGCIGVHWASGFWGMISVGLFAQKTAGILDVDGVFRGGNGELLAYNIAGSIAITVWSFTLTALVFLALKYTIGIRMSLEEEIEGSDAVEHNVLESMKGEGNHVLGKHVEYTGSIRRRTSVKEQSNENGVEMGVKNEAV